MKGLQEVDRSVGRVGEEQLEVKGKDCRGKVGRQGGKGLN